MKKILKNDITMWVGLIAIILLFAYFNHNITQKENELFKQKSLIKQQIKEDKEKVLNEDNDFKFPEYYEYLTYIKEDKKADSIEIKNFNINNEYTKVNYTLVNNYDFDIIIFPIVNKRVDKMEFSLYDFNKSYKVIKSKESVDLELIINGVENEKIKKEDFDVYRAVYKFDKERTPLGYIRIGDSK